MTAIATAVAAPRRGPARWWEGFGAMLRFHATRMRLLIPVVSLVQAFTGAGMVLGFSLLYRAITPEQVLFLSTGAVVINLVVVGLIVGPQLVAQQRLEGTYEWEASLPVPRSANAAAWTALNMVLAVPGAAAALVAAWWRFGADFVISPVLVPGVVLTLTAGALIGHAYAHAIPHPRLIALISQVTIFFVFGFSPIAFPGRNLPGWLESAHTWLPFEHMGAVIRAGLTEGLVTDLGRSFLTLSVWLVAAALLATWAIGRRK